MEQKRLSSEEFIRNKFRIQAEKKCVDEASPLHWHEYFEAEVIIDGKGIQNLNGKDYPLERGAVYFLTPSDFHSIRVEETIHLYNVSFELSMTSLPFLEQAVRRENRVFYPSDAEYSRIAALAALLSDACGCGFGNYEYLNSLLSCMLFCCTSLAGTDNAAAKKPAATSVIQDALLYIHLHFREKLTLNDIARLSHLSPNYFSEMFRRETQKNLSEYLRDLRIDYAQKLLRTTELSVLDICFACGYSSGSNFMKYFKSKTGCSPLRYRKLSREYGKEA